MIDTHCHLTHVRFRDDRPEVLSRARAAGLDVCITIGTGVADAREALSLVAAASGFVRSAAGLDPFTAHRVGDGFGDALAELRELFRADEPVALGEIGLDYHYDLGSPAVQAARLVPQLDLAVDLGRPAVLHVREAHEDMLALLVRHPRARGVVHSFTAGPAEAARYLELGWHLAFNGVLTFPSAPEVQEAARIVPDDRLLVETDAPYLAPVPLRGRRCEPAHVEHTLRRLAELRGTSFDHMRELTSANARCLFRLPAGTPS